MNVVADLRYSEILRKPVAEARIGHVHLRVTDLDRSISFYRDVVGLSVIYYGPSIGVPTVFMAFGDYHHHIALNWFCGTNGSKNNAPLGLNNFAIVFPDESSLANVVARLVEHDGLILDARDHGSTLSVYLQDPDGNGLELYYDRPPTEWVDSAGDLVIKSEPFNVRQWLREFDMDSVEAEDDQKSQLAHDGGTMRGARYIGTAYRMN